jgi:putative transposase
VDRQCSLLGISRSSVYYQPAKTSQENLELRSQGYGVNRKRVRCLMGIMGLRAIHRHPRTSQPAPGHQVYPYLLRGVAITQPNQVWTSDITYIPLAPGFLHGLVQPVCVGLAAIQYPGDQLLH